MVKEEYYEKKYKTKYNYEYIARIYFIGSADGKFSTK